MKIQKIEINNFRQFKDKHVLNLISTKSKPFNIFLGNNGFGKTSTYRAINWCLMKDEPRLKEHQKQFTISRLNTKTLDDLRVGDTKSVSVKIIFLNNKDETISVERIEKYEKTADKTDSSPSEAKHLSSKDEIYISFYDSNGLVEIEGAQAEQFLESKIINTSIRDFFFFDGQDVEEFVEKNSSSSIISHLNTLTGIKELDDVKKNLESLKRDLLKQVPKTGGSDLESTVAEMILKNSERKKKIKLWLNTIKSLEESTDKINVEIRDLKSLISKNEATKNLLVMRDNLDTKISVLNMEYERIDISNKSNILSSVSSVLLRKSLNSFDSIIQKKLDNEELPPPILEDSNDILNFIINEDKITLADQDYGKIKWNKGFSKENFLNAIKDYNAETENKQKSQLAKISINTKEFTSALLRLEPEDIFTSAQDTYLKQKAIKAQIEKLEKERISLINQIGEFDNNKFEKAKISLVNAEQRLKQKNWEYSETQTKILETKNFIKEEDIKIKKFEQLSGKSSVVITKIKFIDDCLKYLIPAIEETRQEILKTTNERLMKRIDSSTLKKNFFKVKITDSYNIEVKNSSNQNTLNSLAVGEKFLVGFSYFQSIQEGLEKKFPMVIDTPLSAIGQELRHGIMQNFINLIGSNIQMTFFFTNSELTESIYKQIEPYISNFYKINISESSEENTVNSYFERQK